MKKVLEFSSREEFRKWLEENGATETECRVFVKRGRPTGDGVLWYLDAVEEALCFGWIDSTTIKIDGRQVQRFTPRKNKGQWTELNKERVRRLEKIGRMTDAGRAVLPPMGPRSFRMDEEVKEALKKARVWSKFRLFPPLYQRVRAYNVAFYKKFDRELYEKALAHLIKATKKGETFGEWNDYGRLSDY